MPTAPPPCVLTPCPLASLGRCSPKGLGSCQADLVWSFAVAAQAIQHLQSAAQRPLPASSSLTTWQADILLRVLVMMFY